jgi:hypothetical protein
VQVALENAQRLAGQADEPLNVVLLGIKSATLAFHGYYSLVDIVLQCI